MLNQYQGSDIVDPGWVVSDVEDDGTNVLVITTSPQAIRRETHGDAVRVQLVSSAAEDKLVGVIDIAPLDLFTALAVAVISEPDLQVLPGVTTEKLIAQRDALVAELDRRARQHVDF